MCSVRGWAFPSILNDALCVSRTNGQIRLLLSPGECDRTILPLGRSVKFPINGSSTGHILIQTNDAVR